MDIWIVIALVAALAVVFGTSLVGTRGNKRDDADAEPDEPKDRG